MFLRSAPRSSERGAGFVFQCWLVSTFFFGLRNKGKQLSVMLHDALCGASCFVNCVESDCVLRVRMQTKNLGVLPLTTGQVA
jgi:hypothetical protein